MRLSQTELKIIEQIANGITDIKSISNNIKKSNKQIYKSSEKLKDHNFLHLSNGVLVPRKTTHVTLLLQLLREFPNLTIILSGSGLQIISSLTKPKKIADIKRETGISKTVIYDKLQQFLDISAIVRLENNKFLVNKSIWNNLYHFLEEFKKYEETTDPRVPANSTIYYKNDNEIIFTCNSYRFFCLSRIWHKTSTANKLLLLTQQVIDKTRNLSPFPLHYRKRTNHPT